MDDLFRSYLALLSSLREGLEQLSALARQKTAAVRNDDLMSLDAVLKQEQAMALTFRGLDQKREKLLAELGLSGLPLSGLVDCYPADLQIEARQAVEALQNQYQIYRTSAEVARNTLEINLHEVEKILTGLGGASTAGPGYTPQEAEPPKAMKTDFRA